MDILFFDIVNTKISLQNECKCLEIVGGNSDYECHFSFSDEWNNLIKSVVFCNNKSKVVIPVLLDKENKCTIPYEVLTYGDVEIGVVGTGSNDTIKSTRVYKLSSGRTIKDSVVDDNVPSKTIYEQVLMALADTESEITTKTSGCIYFDRVQELTPEQQQQVRENINATSQDVIDLKPLTCADIDSIISSI